MSQEQTEAATTPTAPEMPTIEHEPSPPAAKDASLTEIIARRDAAENRAFKEESAEAVEPQVEEAPVDATAQPEGATEVPAAEAEAAPTDELATLRAQNELLMSLFGDDIASQIAPEAAAPTTPEAQAAGQQEDLLARRTFELSEEEIEKIYVEGDPATIKAVEKRRHETLEHNMRLDNNVAVANAVMWFMPVALATKAFNDRNPEFAAWPKAGEIISTALVEARQANPNCNELQLLRKVEQRLDPLIKKAKSIIAQGAQGKRDVGASQSPTAKATTPRAVVPSTPRPSREPSAEERIAELRQYAAQNNYTG